jgi:CubicO group peptidase (beta-lactamase class C family)
MNQPKSSKILAILAIILLITSCRSSASVKTATATLPSTSTTIPTAAPTPTLNPEAQLASKIDGLVKGMYFNGAILAAREGKVLISKGYGMANLEHNVPNTPHTKFRLASMTKQFTAMAILQLQQAGKLNVTDPICLYIRNCPEAWQPITIHELLTHTSGIHEYWNTSSGCSDFKKQYADPYLIIDQFRNLPLDFPPGESWSYTDSGYILLGSIIETVSHLQYATYLQLNIFGPLGMANTGFDDNRLVIPDRAQGYSNATTNADYVDMSVAFSAGGLYSTVEDLFLWDQALYTDKLVSQSLLDEMFKPQAQISTTDSYGYGWFIGNTSDNQQIIFHPGEIEGFHPMIVRYPESKVFSIVLSNREDIDAISIANIIANTILEGK